MKRPIRIAHLADTHLGASSFDGRYSRRKEEAVIDSFLYLISNFIEGKHGRITHVVIAGDVFDNPNPSNKAREAFVTAAEQLHEADIMLICVSGQHDSFKVSNRTHVFDSLGVPENTWMIHADRYPKAMSIMLYPGFKLVCEPWRYNEPVDWEDIAKHKDHRGLVIHLPTPTFATDTNIRYLDREPHGESRIIMCGDYHDKHVERGAYYPGPLQRLTFGEENSKCGFWIHEVGKTSEWFHNPYSFNMWTFDHEVEGAEDQEKIAKLLEIEDTFVRLRLSGNIAAIDLAALVRGDSLVKIEVARLDIEKAQVTLDNASDLAQQFAQFAIEQGYPPEIVKEGEYYINAT